MKRNSNTGWALLLIACGALIVFSRFGLVGQIMGYLIPLVMVGLGYYSIKRGGGLFGWVVLAVGAFILMIKLSWLIGLLLAVGLIVYGVSILRKNKYSI